MLYGNVPVKLLEAPLFLNGSPTDNAVTDTNHRPALVGAFAVFWKYKSIEKSILIQIIYQCFMWPSNIDYKIHYNIFPNIYIELFSVISKMP